MLALGANATQKLGDGTLELSGTVANTGTGAFSVNQGTLRLNKTEPAAIAIPAALVIGDNIGVNNADQVVYAATGSTDQIANAANVTVLNTGLLDLAGQSETITGLTLTAGPTAGDVSTGTGTLTLSGNVTVVAQAGPAVDATISGLLDLGPPAGRLP